MIGIPPEMKEFSIWLNPKILSAFKTLEILALAKNCWKNEALPLDESIQRTLSQGLSESQNDLGQFALRVYFFQFLLDQRVSLDLRSRNFEWNGNFWRFKGTRVAHHFSAELRTALFETYQVFYNTPGASLLPYLERMKLLGPKWNEQTKLDFEKIFWEHFSKGSQGKMTFEIQELLRSFTRIFSFIVQNKTVVPGEFSMIGLYLASLYGHLSELKEPIDVRQAFDYVQNLDPSLRQP